MAGCCGSLKPKINITGTGTGVTTTTTWYDNGQCKPWKPKRQFQWLFYVNNALVHTTAYHLPTQALAIGVGSTGQQLLATHAEIVTFLTTLGNTIINGTKIGIRVRVKNCQDETGLSGFYNFTASTVVPPVIEPFFVRAYDTNRTESTNAVVPGTIPFATSAQTMLFRGGVLNLAGLSVSTEPLVAEEELMYFTTDMDSLMKRVHVTNNIGNVIKPGGVIGLPANRFFVLRNGILDVEWTNNASTITPNEPSLGAETWTFIYFDTAVSPYHLEATNLGFQAGASYGIGASTNSTNQNKWLLFRSHLAMYEAPNTPNTISAYTVDATGKVDFQEPLVAERLVVIKIVL